MLGLCQNLCRGFGLSTKNRLTAADSFAATLEGETFVRYQVDQEGMSVLQPRILCGFANGCSGYVPTADE